MSLQDIHLLFLIIKYANENVSKEYMNKIKKLDEYAKTKLKDSEIIKSYNEVRRESIRKDFGLRNRDKRKLSELDEAKEEEEQEDKFEQIFVEI